MALSRRDFLGVGALSATGLVLNQFAASEATNNEIAAAKDSQPFGALSTARLDLNFDHDWEFHRPDTNADAAIHKFVSGNLAAFPPSMKWEKATLPHSVRLEPRDVSGGQNYQGVCWYRKRFRIRPEWNDRILYLKFQGAMQVADVWINGSHLTTHYGGYIPFTVDITKAVRPDEDADLVVRLDNSDNPQVPPGKPQKELDFVYFGGLYRSVQLQVLDRLHISDPILANQPAGGGLFVTYPSVSTSEATVQVQTHILNESEERLSCTVKQELCTRNGELVATVTQDADVTARAGRTITQTLQVQNPKLWRPEDPQLYWLHTIVSNGGKITDEQYTRIGIRSIRFDREHGLLINHEPFFSIGANRHQDHPYVGYALPASAHFRDAYKLRAAGFTSYRSHYPQDPSFMDACDELGILAVVSNPGWQFVGDDVFKRRTYQDARDMIRRDRNHPCVVIWETQLNESDNSSVAAELYRIAHEEYPGPECYAAGDVIRKAVDGFDGWDVDYYGHTSTQETRPTWIREWGDQVDNWSDQQGRVRVARGWGETPMQVQAATHMASLDKIYASRPMPAGADLWAGIDAYRGYHHQPFLGAPLDLFRLPKFDYYMFQSQRPAQLTPIGIGSGPMVFIANFATFHSIETVTVFSNCEQVRLFQNGKLVATQKPDSEFHIPHPPFTFKVGDFSGTHSMLFAGGVAPVGTEIGELKAEGLIGDNIVATHSIHSPGVPDHVELEIDACGYDPVANGADWVRIHAHVCDARGMTHPYADDLITFAVEGEGSLLSEEAIRANPTRAEAGIATALVRTTQVPGAIKIKACAPGLKEALLEFKSAPRSLRDRL